jgi:cell wall-associated NlpC family hydrolase
VISHPNPTANLEGVLERYYHVSTSSTRARHRAARRPISQVISHAAGDNLIQVGRRSAIVAASSSLLVTMIANPASANDSNVALGTADVTALTSQARAQLAAAPVVTVADASWTVSVEDVEVVKVKPAPEPERAPVVVTPAASRSVERTAAPQADAPAKQEQATKAPKGAASSSTIIAIASRYVGVPYVSGGGTPRGFDCSGFTSYVYAQAGISLPRSSSQQRYAGTVVSRADAKPGDLIWTPGHISIYAGGNQQIDAPVPGKTIQFRSIWQSNPTFIRVTG